MAVECPKCRKTGKAVKTWSYGPKSAKAQASGRPSFDVTIYECPSGHKWRVYQRKK